MFMALCLALSALSCFQCDCDYVCVSVLSSQKSPMKVSVSAAGSAASASSVNDRTSSSTPVSIVH